MCEEKKDKHSLLEDEAVKLLVVLGFIILVVCVFVTASYGIYCFITK